MSKIKALFWWNDGWYDYRNVPWPLMPVFKRPEWDRDDIDMESWFGNIMKEKPCSKQSPCVVKEIVFILLRYSDGSFEYRQES